MRWQLLPLLEVHSAKRYEKSSTQYKIIAYDQRQIKALDPLGICWGLHSSWGPWCAEKPRPSLFFLYSVLSKSIEVQEVKLNRTLHCNSCAHDMTGAAAILDWRLHRIMGASRAWPTYNNTFKVYIYIYSLPFFHKTFCSLETMSVSVENISSSSVSIINTELIPTYEI